MSTHIKFNEQAKHLASNGSIDLLRSSVILFVFFAIRTHITYADNAKNTLRVIRVLKRFSHSNRQDNTDLRRYVRLKMLTHSSAELEVALATLFAHSWPAFGDLRDSP